MSTKYVVSYAEVHCDDGIPEITTEQYDSFEDAWNAYQELKCHNVQTQGVQLLTDLPLSEIEIPF